MDFYSLSACPSGSEYSFDDSNGTTKNVGCTSCSDSLFSTGFPGAQGCQECSFWQRFNSEAYYKKQVIDIQCDYKDNFDND